MILMFPILMMNFCISVVFMNYNFDQLVNTTLTQLLIKKKIEMKNF